MQEIRNNAIYSQNIGFKAATKPEEQATPQVEHKSHDGALILGVLAAGAATVGAIALIKKRGKGTKATEKATQKVENVVSDTVSKVKPKFVERLAPEKLQTEVLAHLKDFKGTNEEYAHAAYRLLVKAHGSEEIAPQLVIKSIEEGDHGTFSMVHPHELLVSANDIGSMTHQDIVGVLSHEFEHFHQYADVACVLGHEDFIKGIKKDLQNIAIIRFRKMPECAEAFKKLDEEARQGLSAQSLEDLIKGLDEETVKNSERVKRMFPDGYKHLSKEQIVDISAQEVINKANEEIFQGFKSAPEYAQMLEPNADFWAKVIEKRGRKTPEQIDYDIAPLIDSFKKGHPNKEDFDDITYDYCLQRESYLNSPFEIGAWETQFRTTHTFGEFAKKQGIEIPPATIEDGRPNTRNFSKINKRLEDTFVSFNARDISFDLLKYHSANKVGTDTAGIMADIAADSNGEYGRIIGLYKQLDDHFAPTITDPIDRAGHLHGLFSEKINAGATKMDEMMQEIWAEVQKA